MFPLKKFFDLWRLNFDEARNFEIDVVSIFMDQRMRRLLNSWHALAVRSTRARGAAFQKRKAYDIKMKRAIFRRYVSHKLLAL